MQIRRRIDRRPTAVNRPGFTIIELAVVVMIGGVLAAIAIPQFSRHTSHRAAINARDAFIGTASQARAAAIRSGEEVLLQVDRDNARVLTTLRRDGSTVAPPLDLGTGALRGEILGTGAFTLCYSPRGFTLPGCGTTDPPPPSIVGFVSPEGRDTAWARITLGRAVRQ